MCKWMREAIKIFASIALDEQKSNEYVFVAETDHKLPEPSLDYRGP